MKTGCLSKTFSLFTAAMLAACCTVPLTVNGEETPVLKITQVQITEETLASGGTASVDVTISNNTDGFLATSFGIQYDTSLILEEVVLVNTAGQAHAYACNAETGLIWFSGAAGSGSSSANVMGEETMFTLQFTLPEDAEAGDSYPLSFNWIKADGRQGYWHLPSRTNVVGGLQSNAINGSISVADPNAPQLSNTSLDVTTGGTQTLSVNNYEGTAVWFSDNSQVASVENGIVTGITAGSCTVYALVNGTPLSCAVTVTEEAYYDITETEVIYIRDPNKKVILECPAVSNPEEINWISDNTSVVTVNNGVLQGLQNGAATIYALCEDAIYTTKVIVEFEEDNTGNGDVTQDGNVSIIDVVCLNRNLLIGESLDHAQQNAADVNMDGSVDVTDAMNILKYIIHLVETLPTEV